MRYPEGTHREDMLAGDALQECYDLWASGAWSDSNAEANLEEVMDHVKRLLDASTLPDPAWYHLGDELCTSVEVSQELPGIGICLDHDRRVWLKYADGRAAR